MMTNTIESIAVGVKHRWTKEARGLSVAIFGDGFGNRVESFSGEAGIKLVVELNDEQLTLLIRMLQELKQASEVDRAAAAANGETLTDEPKRTARPAG